MDYQNNRNDCNGNECNNTDYNANSSPFGRVIQRTLAGKRKRFADANSNSTIASTASTTTSTADDGSRYHTSLPLPLFITKYRKSIVTPRLSPSQPRQSGYQRRLIASSDEEEKDNTHNNIDINNNSSIDNEVSNSPDSTNNVPSAMLVNSLGSEWTKSSNDEEELLLLNGECRPQLYEESLRRNIPLVMSPSSEDSNNSTGNGCAEWRRLKRTLGYAKGTTLINPNKYPPQLTAGILNRFVARNLLEHQLHGIKWLWWKYCLGEGAILGDDMGMGKTIQIAALLCVVYGKTGLVDTDESYLREKRKAINDLLYTTVRGQPCHTENPLTKYRRPSLILVPKAVIGNWEEELKRWGVFHIVKLDSTIREAEFRDVVRKARQCGVEIILLTYSQVGRFACALADIAWEAVVYDEAHLIKNHKSKLFNNVTQSSKCARCRIMLSGTPIQNNLQELWVLFSVLFDNRFYSRSEFTSAIAEPLKLGLREEASVEEQRQAEWSSSLLQGILEDCLLRRDKSSLQDTVFALKGKNEYIIFCDLSPLQKDLYCYILNLPDFENLRLHAQQCACGSRYTRGKCCVEYRLPIVRPATGSYLGNEVTATKEIADSTAQESEALQQINHSHSCDLTDNTSLNNNNQRHRKQKTCNNLKHNEYRIDPRAVLWRQNHRNEKPCSATSTRACPTCIMLPALQLLGKIAAHPALLQYDPNAPEDTASEKKELRMKQFINEALSSDLRHRLGGDTRSRKVLDDSLLVNSGKLQTLHSMLKCFVEEEKVKTLVFSHSTKLLDIAAKMIRNEGWTFSRLDGHTSANQRTKLVKEFNQSEYNYIFLISSKAGGVGLNLSSAQKVIIFDVNWNPTIDMQSQDRAYRIGQKEHVTVFRLLATGTIEELIYMRQLYKQIIQNSILKDSSSATSTAANNSSSKNSNTDGGNYDEEEVENLVSQCLSDDTNRGGNRESSHKSDVARACQRWEIGPFRGVEGHARKQGELFGSLNLFQYHRGGIIKNLKKKYGSRSSRSNIITVLGSDGIGRTCSSDSSDSSVIVNHNLWAGSISRNEAQEYVHRFTLDIVSRKTKQ